MRGAEWKPGSAIQASAANGPHIHAQPFFMIPVLRDAKYSNLNQ
jgi:hypothetical protein